MAYTRWFNRLRLFRKLEYLLLRHVQSLVAHFITIVEFYEEKVHVTFGGNLNRCLAKIIGVLVIILQ